MLLKMMGMRMRSFCLGEDLPDIKFLSEQSEKDTADIDTDTGRGKVFVYTGILPICGDEDGLAAVLGHEIAHIVARHPAERMSNSFLTLGVVFMISFLFDVSGQFTSLLVNLMYGLPNSRSQEVSTVQLGRIDDRYG